MLLTPDDEQLEALADSGPLLVVGAAVHAGARGAIGRSSSSTELLRDRFQMRELVIGYDHGLGRGREGDAAMLTELGAGAAFDVDVVPPTLDATGAPISSSAIRTSIAHGDLDRARAALGRPYGFAARSFPAISAAARSAIRR